VKKKVERVSEFDVLLVTKYVLALRKCLYPTWRELCKYKQKFLFSGLKTFYSIRNPIVTSV